MLFVAVRFPGPGNVNLNWENFTYGNTALFNGNKTNLPFYASSTNNNLFERQNVPNQNYKKTLFSFLLALLEAFSRTQKN